MADDNKISLDFEINEQSVDAAYSDAEKRGEKSAKDSAVFFEEYFQSAFNEIQGMIEGLTKVTEKSAKESAQVFVDAFKKADADLLADQKKRDQILAASQKQNIQNALDKIVNGGKSFKSAADSASVFEAQLDPTWAKLKQIGATFSSYKGVLLGVTAGLYGVEKAAAAVIDTVKEGDKIAKIEKQFSTLAESAGLSADVLRYRLVGAAQGLADDTDILKSANNAIVNLGASAEKLPELFEVARKAAALTGDDLTQVFDTLTSSISTLNTRQLKNLNLVIDNEAAYKKYAASIGASADNLSESGKRNALLNAILEQSAVKYKDVSVEANNATSALTKLSVAANNAYESFAKRLAKGAAGTFIKDAADALRLSIGQIPSDLAEMGDMSLAELSNIQRDAKELLDRAAADSSFLERVLGIQDAQKAIVIQQYETVLRQVSKIIADKAGASLVDLKRQAEAAIGKVGGPGDIVQKTLSPEEARAQRDALNAALLASDIKLAQDQETLRQAQLANDGVLLDQKTLAEQNYFNDKKMIEMQYLQDIAAARAQFRTIDASNTQLYADLIAKIEADKQAKLLSAQNNFIVESEKGFLNLKKIAQDALVNGLASSFAALGRAMNSAENESEAFADALIQALGNLAVQIGTMLVAVGLGFTAAGAILPAWASAGAQTTAAGLALIALGGAMGATGGGETAGDAGGGSLSAGPELSAGNEVPNPEDLAPTGPKVVVNLEVRGNILDRRETGLELSEIIRETIADQGVQLGV